MMSSPMRKISSRYHELDNMELTKDEIRKMNDTKYTYDFSRYPR